MRADPARRDVDETLALLLTAAFLVLCACRSPSGFSFHLHDDPPPAFAPLAFQALGVMLRPGHAVSFAENGAVFDAVVEDIGQARSSIDLVMYIWKKGEASDRVIAALSAKARQHVTCRVLVDAFGSPDSKTELQPLVEAGCEVRVFRPIPGVDDLARNHRKLLIVDGKLAVTGGFGIRDNWLGDGLQIDHWRDSNVRIAGPAVREMQLAFAANWLESGGALLSADAFPVIEPAGPMVAAFVPSTGAAVGTPADRLTQLAILSARKRLWITNAYFVPNGAIYEGLKEKAKAGVDVRLLTAGARSDSKPAFAIQQAEYGPLRKTGVKVWEYQPAMIHAKTMLVDDDLVVVGSINLDPLSLNKLEEGAVVVQDRGLAGQLEQQFLVDVGRSKAIP
jgi:cardiolipin synthase